MCHIEVYLVKVLASYPGSSRKLTKKLESNEIIGNINLAKNKKTKKENSVLYFKLFEIDINIFYYLNPIFVVLHSLK